MPKFLIVVYIYGIFVTATVLRGTRWVIWCILKQNSQQRHHLGSFIQLL